jgi:hypothetical protein
MSIATLTTDRNDPDLGVTRSDGQNKKYLVLSQEELAKGYVKPYRSAYIHDAVDAPKGPLRDLTAEEHERYDQYLYIKYEEGAERYWTQERLDRSKRKCGVVTTMGLQLSATYARDPKFYNATYCCGCGTHYPLNEFHWTADGEPMDPSLQDAWAEEQKKQRDAARAMTAEWARDRLTPSEEARVGAALSIGRQQHGIEESNELGLLARIVALEAKVARFESKQDER